MSTDLMGIPPATRRTVAKSMRRLARALLIAVGIAAACAVVLAGRYLLFEYRYGDRQMVQHLLDHLLP